MSTPNQGTYALITAAQGILQDVLTEATVTLGIPKGFNSRVNVYLYESGFTDPSARSPGVAFAGGHFDRTHFMPIHLLVPSGADAATEQVLYDLSDRIGDAFYSHYTLNGTAKRAKLYQMDGRQTSAAMFVIDNGVEYRHRWWTLEADEERLVTLAY